MRNSNSICAWCEKLIPDDEDDIEHADRCRAAMFPEDKPHVLTDREVRALDRRIKGLPR